MCLLPNFLHCCFFQLYLRVFLSCFLSVKELYYWNNLHDSDASKVRNEWQTGSCYTHSLVLVDSPFDEFHRPWSGSTSDLVNLLKSPPLPILNHLHEFGSDPHLHYRHLIIGHRPLIQWFLHNYLSYKVDIFRVVLKLCGNSVCRILAKNANWFISYLLVCLFFFSTYFWASNFRSVISDIFA